MSESNWRFRKFSLVYLVWTHCTEPAFCVFSRLQRSVRICFFYISNLVLAVIWRSQCRSKTAVENRVEGSEDAEPLTYTSRCLRRRRNSGRWEVVLSHTDPVTGEVVRKLHTAEGETHRQVERTRDALILDLERKGEVVDSSMSVRHDVVAVAITGDRQATLSHLVGVCHWSEN